MNGIGELNQMTLTAEKVTDVLFIGNAYSYGAELFVQKTIGRLTGWAGYGLGYIYARFDSINHGNEFHPKYDRTHDFKVVLQYKLFDNIEVGGTFSLQSGQSYTGATSRGKTLLPDQTFGNSKITMSDLYGLRLPISHQLNLYAAYNFKMWKKDARLVIDIFNAYNRRDILMRMYNTRDEVTVVEDMRLLPIIPSLSLEVKF
jgi:outer membrane receptor protein involved in Fe transport